ncbi:MAG: sulfurtransferase TusA family protein [Halobacteriales archaeon]
MSETIDADVTIDSKGAGCPGPLMDLIGKVKSADVGTVFELQTTDSSSKSDVPEWIDESGHEMLEIVDQGDFWSIYVEKTG